MSLNGLDDASVQEAYQQANTEAGGWLLLKYNSRDSVDLLGRGKGGAPDARAAIARYEDASPLYGLIVYRRRKVLIKYVPEGTSRVLLARTAVHWQDILEKFTPYETVLEIKTSDGLNDTSLAASFPLHTASPSTSSHRLHERLQEISEDAEDSSSTVRPSMTSTASSSSNLHSQRHRVDRREHRLRNTDRSPPPTINVDEAQAKPPSNLPPASPPPAVTSPKKAHISQFLVRDDSGQRSVTSLSSASTAPTSQFSNTDTPTMDKQPAVNGDDVSDGAASQSIVSKMAAPATQQPSSATTTTSYPLAERQRQLRGVELLTQKPPPEPEMRPELKSVSSNPGRPITRQEVSAQTAEETSGSLKFDDDPYDFSRFDLKPKVRLAPRPVAGDKAKRPSMAGVASVPATYRPTTAKKQESVRPKSQGPMNVPVLAVAPPVPPPIPDMPEYKPRPVSRGSIKSLPSHKSSAMTPDKIRLMKAVELRKKQMRKSNSQVGTLVQPADEDVPSVPKLPEYGGPGKEEPEQKPERGVMRGEDVQEEAKAQEQEHHSEDLSAGEQQASAAKKADSGISMDYEQAKQGADEEADQDVEEPYTREAEVEQNNDDEPESSSAETPKASAVDPALDDLPTGPLEPKERASRPGSTNFDLDTAGATSTSQPTSPVSDTDHDGMSQSLNSLGVISPFEDEATVVPTIMMGDGTRPVSSIGSEEDRQFEQSQDENGHDHAEVSSEDEDDITERPPRKSNDLAKRRRGYVEPLQIDPEAEYSSDDELMQELQSATVQEATPIAMAKSPMAGYFPRRPSGNSMVSEVSVRSTSINRASTLPTVDFTEMQDRLSPDPAEHPYGPSRNMSAGSIERMDPLSAMRRNVSSGISRRIQALAERTSRETSPHGSPSTRSVSPEVMREQSDSRRSPPPHAARASSFRALHRQSSRTSYHQSQRPMSSMPQRESNAIWSVQQDPSSGRNSVSVSARIVRPIPVETADADEADAQLQQPEVAVNHEREASKTPQLHSLDTTQQLPQSQSEPTVTSPTSPRSPTETRQLHSSSRFGRHKSTLSTPGPSADDFPPPPTHHTTPLTVEQPSIKETTRTSRFFKRMSTIGVSKRKSGVPQSIASSTSPVSERGSLIGASNMLSSTSTAQQKPETPPATVLGDLNIQFPDSLVSPIYPTRYLPNLH
ncbi:uncharacterized protein LTR77_007463 [Saxophila tyrrhenica]|uniref:ADF-H domain-containing protein n=1 Tax=Saxophila tyrrhenica TaxID=1690608 RepID=A0AAV9P7R3_9PEZI|nr:hypothetical protein LTR77_007463 [Saxophila tyrrhenica]